MVALPMEKEGKKEIMGFRFEGLPAQTMIRGLEGEKN